MRGEMWHAGEIGLAEIIGSYIEKTGEIHH
jgi:hypothetical protein